MSKALIALGITGFVFIYFILVPYLLWTAPTMEDDYEEKDIRRTYGIYDYDNDTDGSEGKDGDQHGTL